MTTQDDNLFSVGGQVAAIRTLNAGFWELLFVRLFGKRVRGMDNNCVLHGRLYKGKLYLLRYEELG